MLSANTEVAGERQLWVEVGLRHTDAGSGRRELSLDLSDVGSAAKQLSWESDGHAPGSRGNGAGLLQLCDQRLGFFAEKNSELMDGRLLLDFQRWYFGLRLRELGPCAGHVKVADDASRVESPGDLQRLALRLDVRVGDDQTLLCRAEFHVIARHFGDDRYHHASPRIFLRLEISLGGFDGAPDAAEDVCLPNRIEARGIKLVVARVDGEQRASAMIVCVASACTDARKQPSGRDRSLCPGFPNP